MASRMRVNIVFFGSIADKLSMRECCLDASEHMTVADLVKAVGCADVKPLLVAVNQTQVNDMNTPVKAGDEVAIMPPFSGG